MADAMERETQISVVMCVYNAGPGLPATLESTLSQQGVDLEFIVVNDGSTDETSTVLREHAVRDNRLRILERTHCGLTQSLIHGCAEARGQFIARQDAGDVSLPGRLKSQFAAFKANPEAVLVSCGTRFKGPRGEPLYQVLQATEVADAALRSPDSKTLQGPSHHGCTMFSKKNYLRAGGYRSQFKVAQDLDLWTRLIELGRHEVVQEILYETVLVPGCISSRMRRLQVATKELILECMHQRMTHGDDSALVDRVALIDGGMSRIDRHKADAEFCYFVASCLREKDPLCSKHYFMAALKNNPFHLKALFRAVQAHVHT